MGKRRSNRRDFLRGRSAADSLADVVDDVLGAPIEEDSPPDHGPAHYIVQYARRAMACQFEVYVNAGQYPNAAEAALAALDLVDRLEDQLSVYRADSEVSRLNRAAADGPVKVEPRLFALLSLAVELHRQTGGAYDVTSGPLSEVWGFMRRAGTLPDADAIRDALERAGSQHLHLDEPNGSVRFARPGMAINLGSIGKGYALDRCAELLAEYGVADFMLHGGHSSILARGSRGSQTGWSVGVRNPLRPRHRVGEYRLRDGALATSGSGTQFFVHEGRRYGHLLDPRTGWPAEGVLSSTAVAPTAAIADALATAFYVLGPEGAREYCAAHPGIGAILLCPGKRTGSVQVHAIGAVGEDWRMFEDA